MMRSFLMKITPALGITLFSFASPSPAQATPVPHLHEATAEPVRTPYPDASLASTQVREAFITASKTHRRVLLDFGGNWCPDCRMLSGVFALPDVDQWLEQNFVIVPVNVERLKNNMDIAQKYGVTIKAIPTVLLLTADGRLLNKDGTLDLGNARRMSPQAAVDLLGQWNSRQ